MNQREGRMIDESSLIPVLSLGFQHLSTLPREQELRLVHPSAFLGHMCESECQWPRKNKAEGVQTHSAPHQSPREKDMWSTRQWVWTLSRYAETIIQNAGRIKTNGSFLKIQHSGRHSLTLTRTNAHHFLYQLINWSAFDWLCLNLLEANCLTVNLFSFPGRSDGFQTHMWLIHNHPVLFIILFDCGSHVRCTWTAIRLIIVQVLRLSHFLTNERILIKTRERLCGALIGWRKWKSFDLTVNPWWRGGVKRHGPWDLYQTTLGP